LIEKQGFQRDGLLRSYEYERGAYVDLYMLSLLREEWESRA
jgi:ribosomal-protein-alanine N-acetyltransferase